MTDTTMLRAAGAGAAAGLAIGALAMSRRSAAKTSVGRKIQAVGSSVDCALYDLLRSMR